MSFVLILTLKLTFLTILGIGMFYLLERTVDHLYHITFPPNLPRHLTPTYETRILLDAAKQSFKFSADLTWYMGFVVFSLSCVLVALMPDGYEQRDLDLDFLTPSLASLLTQQIRLAELQQRRQPAVPTEARVEEVEGEEIEPACLGAFETERSWRDGG